MASLYKKPVKVTDPVTGERKTARSKKWYGRYRDADGTEHRVPLACDKRIAQQMLNDILNRVERVKAGLVDDIVVEMKKSLTEHIDDYEQHLRAKNDSKYHITCTINMLKNVARTRKWKDIRDLKASELEAFLNWLRNEKHLSIERGNHYIRACKSFTHWLLDNDRINKDPFRKIKVLNASTDQRHHRRPLSMEEFSLMVDAANSGPPIQGISGQDRAMLYYIAAWTGLRRKELGSLTLNHIFLDAPVPYLTVPAAYSKRKRDDVLYLHEGLVGLLKKWLDRKKPDKTDLLFSMVEETGGVERKTSKMILFDLNSARNFWISEASSPEEIQKREESDFLKYKDSQGRFADFHCLRHTFITNLSLSGVSPKIAQTLARHSDIKLTMNIYTHMNAQSQINAINTLPSPNQQPAGSAEEKKEDPDSEKKEGTEKEDSVKEKNKKTK